MMTTEKRSRCEQFTLDGIEYNRGDQIRVLPSAPRHRDGFIGKVLAATFEDGEMLFIDVFGAPGSKAPATRSLPPERLTAPPRAQRGPRRSKYTKDAGNE